MRTIIDGWCPIYSQKNDVDLRRFRRDRVLRMIDAMVSVNAHAFD